MLLYREQYLRLNREIRNSLQVLYGVGLYKSLIITTRMGLAYPFCINHLNLYTFTLLSTLLEGWTWLEIRIKREIKQKIRILIESGSYKGKRHLEGLPCRGQRTRTNASKRKFLI